MDLVFEHTAIFGLLAQGVPTERNCNRFVFYPRDVPTEHERNSKNGNADDVGINDGSLHVERASSAVLFRRNISLVEKR